MDGLFNFLRNTLYGYSCSYTLDVAPDELLRKLNLLFTERAGLFKSPNLRGGFGKDPASFFLTRKWWPGYIRGFGSNPDPVTLSGRISGGGTGQARLEINVKPNFIFLFFLALLLPFAVYQAIALGHSGNLHDDGGLLLLMVIAGAFLLLMAKWLADSIRRAMEKFLELPPAD
jgi:hypothetical protein